MENRINKEMDYLGVLEIFNNSNLQTIEEKFGHKYISKIVLGFLASITLVGNAFFSQYSTWIMIVFVLMLFACTLFYILYIKKKAISYFGEESRGFIKQNKTYWRGIRALIFFEKIFEQKMENKKFKINQQYILKSIEIEQELKRFEMLKTPIFLGLIALWSMLLNNIFDKLTLSWLLLIAFILIFVSWFSYNFISIVRTEESKMNDLKLFIHWYSTIPLKIEKFTFK